MKKIFIITFILLSFQGIAQETRTMFTSELAPFTLQCEHIGRSISDKNVASDLSKWYEGPNLEKLTASIREIEGDINQSAVEVTYRLSLLREQSPIYLFHFHAKDRTVEFGQLFIYFEDDGNALVDDYKLLTKIELEEINSEIKNNIELKNIPPPPPPPPLIKKKNE